MKNVIIHSNPLLLAEAAAESIINLGKETILKSGRFSIALAGGSTPEATYREIVKQASASQFDWSPVNIFWGDERCVPPEHPDSNYRMASQALLNHISIPKRNVHRMRGELEPSEGASNYQKALLSFFGPNPQFDLILLGMGTDGHTASLFPGTEAVLETETWVEANFIQSLSSWRLTLTPAIINQAHNIIFLVSGEAKAATLRKVLQGKIQPDLYPSQIIQPDDGTLKWFIDKHAAVDLAD